MSVRTIIAEDESILRLFLSMTLTSFGLDVLFEAQSGIEVVEAVRELEPDIVFLDINMETKEDGLDACAEIKKEFPEIKVFFISAYPQKVFQQRLDFLQYEGYLEKPVNKEHLKKFLAGNEVIQAV